MGRGRPGRRRAAPQRAHFYSALPAGEFPNMVELSPELAWLPTDRQFHAGLDVLLKGLAAERP